MAFNGDTKVEITTPNSLVYSVAFTQDGKHVVSGESRLELHRWSIADRAVVGSTMGTSGNVYAIAVSKDGKWIVAGDSGYRVTVWNAKTHATQRQVTEHTDEVWAVDISDDSTRFASGSRDYTVRIFDIASGIRIIPPLQHNDYVVGVKFSPDGSRIATAAYQRSVRVYDTHTGSNLVDIPVSVLTSNPCTPLAWCPNGQQLFAVSNRSASEGNSKSSGGRNKKINSKSFARKESSALPGIITCLELSTSARSEWSTGTTGSRYSIVTNGNFMALSSGYSVSFWDVVSHKQIGSPIQHSSEVYSIALSPDQRKLACGNRDKISIHDLSNVLPVQESHSPGSIALPPMELTDQVLQSWRQDDLGNTEKILSEEISRSSQPSHYTLANRAVVRARCKQWSAALEDVSASLQIIPSPIGHIAKALALAGRVEHDLAIQAFDFVFHDCDPKDNRFLLLLKAIHLFVSGKQDEGVSRLDALIVVANDDSKWYYYQVLSYMYMIQKDYKHAVDMFERSKELPPSQTKSRLETISLIFGWKFDTLEFISWQRLCESLYSSGLIKEVAEILSKMIEPLEEGKKEAAHGRILEEIISHSGEVTLLAWTGSSSKCNSCLPASPSVYKQTPHAPPSLEGRKMDARIAELRDVFPLTDAMLIYSRVTGLQSVRFAHFRLHLPCIVFPINGLRKEGESVYHAKVTSLGDLEFTTKDGISLKDPCRLVLVHPWIRYLCGSRRAMTLEEYADSDVDSKVDIDAELVHEPLDLYKPALELIARLGQPFSALLLLRQSDGSYKRVAAEREIVVSGLGDKVPKDIRVEVLEVL